MLGSKVYCNILLRVPAEYLAHLVEGFARHDNFFGVIGFSEPYFADGYSVPVRGDHLHLVSFDLKQLPGHQLVVLIVGDGKDCLPYHFF